MELYLGNNLISDIKELIKLKALGRLIILDISGNYLSRD
jgi:Leucine-rich repeat (LRR) protein